MGAYPTVWVEDSEGRYVYGSTVPEMKEALAAWASWYKEGSSMVSHGGKSGHELVYAEAWQTGGTQRLLSFGF